MAFLPRRRVVCFALLTCALACGPKPAEETTSTTDSPPATTGPEATGGASTTGETTLIETTSTVTGNPTTASPTTNPTTPDPTTTSPTTTGDGSVFITPHDAGGHGGCAAIASKDCDPWVQDCPSDSKCSPASGGCDDFSRTICTELPAQPVPIGGACTSEMDPLSGRNDCEIGATCWFIDPLALTGTCVSLCHGSPDVPDCSHVPGTGCVFVHDGAAAPLCLPTCDPFEPTCPAGHHCHPTIQDPAVFACTPDTFAPLGAAFEPCERTNCAAGLLCSEPEVAAVECGPDSNCCTPLCDLDTPDCPGAGQVCLPYFEMGQAPSGLEDVGRCGLQ
ncbi:hypothetical protein [Nannocystis punicea]|uniref:Uncharacterized protein n=1 Tax=Nannocystis punicea TaxID=2995304 RepID=A0ABY7H255_9BACT|nr:hypothetical protein [Nannocystis poenicansa]WAS93212.1 hypothetical protein O0S08_44185 [Nannocystis poenicansa]